MTIPDYQTLMLPFLKLLKDEKEHNLKEVIDGLCSEFKLTEQERLELLPSGTQPIIDNRIGWARTYILKAGLIESPKRGFIKITKRGIEILNKKLDKINIKFLEQFPEFIEFRTIKREQSAEKSKASTEIEKEVENKTPDELMDRGYNSINASLTQELLEKLRNIDPYFFEKVVGELLTMMGYGRFEATLGSGDGGIDGIVYQDKLGLDKIFFQAKRYGEGNSVSARDVRDFVGTLELHGAHKGIFITTSRFPKDTNDILKKTSKNIILIDGPKLAELMIENDVGVSTHKIYKIKIIDSDFFPI